MQNACSTHAFYVHHAYIVRDTLHVRWACTTRALHVHGTRGTVSHKSLAVHVQYNDTCPCMACMLLCMVTCALHAHCLSSARIARAAFGALSNYAHCIPRLLCLTSPCACSGSPFSALHVHDPDPTHTRSTCTLHAHITHPLNYTRMCMACDTCIYARTTPAHHACIDMRSTRSLHMPCACSTHTHTHYTCTRVSTHVFRIPCTLHTHAHLTHEKHAAPGRRTGSTLHTHYSLHVHYMCAPYAICTCSLLLALAHYSKTVSCIALTHAPVPCQTARRTPATCILGPVGHAR